MRLYSSLLPYLVRLQSTRICLALLCTLNSSLSQAVLPPTAAASFPLQLENARGDSVLCPHPWLLRGMWGCCPAWLDRCWCSGAALESRTPGASLGFSMSRVLVLSESLACVLSTRAKVNAKPEGVVFYAKAACQLRVNSQGGFAGPSSRFELMRRWVFAGLFMPLVLRWELLRCWC